MAELEARIVHDGNTIEAELRFLDEGHSGSTLQRPALERLRDQAYAGTFQRVYVHSPDRLSRNYAHQMLLLDELRRHGIEVTFLNHAVTDSPEGELLLQMQGMIAEYERAKIMERSRRGKRHAAQRGCVNVLSGAPYGYRYVAASTGQASYQIDDAAATLVRQLFTWVGLDRLSLGAVRRRLHEAGHPSPRGKTWWDRTTLWGMLKNPAYQGQAAFGKTRVGPKRSRLRPQRNASSRQRCSYSTYDTSEQERTSIAVPAIVSAELFALVQEQLTVTRQGNRETKRGARYLLQGLIACSGCQYAYYGKPVSRPTTTGKSRAYYYRCIGSDAYRFAGQRLCWNKQVRGDLLEEAVWDDVCRVLRCPSLLQQEYDRRQTKPSVDQVRHADLNKQVKHAERIVSRLIDSYSEGLLEKAEFEPRLRQARQVAQQRRSELQQLEQNQQTTLDLQVALGNLDAFATQIRNGLQDADWQTRRELIRTLVKSIKVEPSQIRITYRITTPPFSTRTPPTYSNNPVRLHDLVSQLCWRGDNSPLGCSLLGRQPSAISQDPGLEHASNEAEHPTIRNSLSDEGQ